MILSQTAVYALRAVLHLAERGAGERVPVSEIAAELGVPGNYLSKIFHTLTREGVLDSTRGQKGGFSLALDPSSLPLSRVIAPFDDITRSSGCLLGREKCSNENPCAAHGQWQEVSLAVRGFLDETTVMDLARTGQAASLGATQPYR